MKLKLPKFPSTVSLAPVLFCLLSFIIGWQVGHRDLGIAFNNGRPGVSMAADSQPPAGAGNIDFSLFWQTWNLLNKEYVDKKALDPQKMYYGAISGMVAAVGDPYTVFLPPQSQKSIKEELGGSFEGVGFELGYNKDNQLVVIAPLDNTPAQKAGIRAGDLILKINNKDTTGISLPDAVNAIRGPKGSSVALQIYHQGDTKPVDLSVLRDTIVVKSVTYVEKTSPQGQKIGVIKVSRFGDNTDDEWNSAVSQVLANGDSGVVLDLRNNPGGYLDDAVYIGSEFLNQGNVVQQEDGQGQRQGYKVNRQGKLLQIPLTVLINKGSASASEIVAGAIQDNKRGELLGEQSFGKGTIQAAQDLPQGTGIHITTDKWLTPNGRWIHNIGLTPDVAVDQGTDVSIDPVLNKALGVLDQQK